MTCGTVCRVCADPRNATGARPGAQPAEPAARLLAEAVRFVPDVARLLARVIADPRVPAAAKVQAGALLALGLSPLDLVPVLGQLEAVAALALAARRLADAAGQDVLREHWVGSDEGYAVLMALVASGLRPRRLLWRLLRGRR